MVRSKRDLSITTCKCGCGQDARPGKQYVWSHYAKTTRGPRNSKPDRVDCACGCGRKASPGATYIHGHHRRGLSSTPLRESQNGRWQGADAPLSAKYQRAHKKAKRRLGSRPDRCPTCGKIITVELSFIGIAPVYFDDRKRPYDPTGVEYIYECHPCNVKRGYALRRNNMEGSTNGQV